MRGRFFFLMLCLAWSPVQAVVPAAPVPLAILELQDPPRFYLVAPEFPFEALVLI